MLSFLLEQLLISIPMTNFHHIGIVVNVQGIFFFSTWRLVLFNLKTITPSFCLANHPLISFHGNILVQGNIVTLFIVCS
jgi:hypothetical protein